MPESPLCVKGGLACLPHVVAAVEGARAKGLPVFWIIREHDPSGASTFFRAGCSGKGAQQQQLGQSMQLEQEVHL